MNDEKEKGLLYSVTQCLELLIALTRISRQLKQRGVRVRKIRA